MSNIARLSCIVISLSGDVSLGVGEGIGDVDREPKSLDDGLPKDAVRADHRCRLDRKCGVVGLRESLLVQEAPDRAVAVPRETHGTRIEDLPIRIDHAPNQVGTTGRVNSQRGSANIGDAHKVSIVLNAQTTAPPEQSLQLVLDRTSGRAEGPCLPSQGPWAVRGA